MVLERLFIFVYVCFQAGKVPSLTTLVEEFLSATREDKKDILQKLEEEAEKLKGAAARFVFATWPTNFIMLALLGVSTLPLCAVAIDHVNCSIM